jgi:hypothetical protein
MRAVKIESRHGRMLQQRGTGAQVLHTSAQPSRAARERAPNLNPRNDRKPAARCRGCGATVGEKKRKRSGEKVVKEEVSIFDDVDDEYDPVARRAPGSENRYALFFYFASLEYIERRHTGKPLTHQAPRWLNSKRNRQVKPRTFIRQNRKHTTAATSVKSAHGVFDMNARLLHCAPKHHQASAVHDSRSHRTLLRTRFIVSCS